MAEITSLRKICYASKITIPSLRAERSNPEK
jgi:hypothetical protein